MIMNGGYDNDSAYDYKLNILGVIPRDIWNRQRAQDLIDAINRYTKAGLKVPVEWIEEFNELMERKG